MAIRGINMQGSVPHLGNKLILFNQSQQHHYHAAAGKMATRGINLQGSVPNLGIRLILFNQSQQHHYHGAAGKMVIHCINLQGRVPNIDTSDQSFQEKDPWQLKSTVPIKKGRAPNGNWQHQIAKRSIQTWQCLSVMFTWKQKMCACIVPA
eukprot:1156480-Pelagomonas_calceolata.AAC.5